MHRPLRQGLLQSRCLDGESGGLVGTHGVSGRARASHDSLELYIFAGGSELWRISLEGGEPVHIDLPTNIPFKGRNLSVHPDGHQIVFSAGQPAAEVWVLDNVMAELATK